MLVVCVRAAKCTRAPSSSSRTGHPWWRGVVLCKQAQQAQRHRRSHKPVVGPDEVRAWKGRSLSTAQAGPDYDLHIRRLGYRAQRKIVGLHGHRTLVHIS